MASLKAKFWLGVDANETFTSTTSGPPLAHRARGEEVLHSFLEWGLAFPPQQLPVPSFHPYNTTMLSRRLDYVLCRGSVWCMTGGVHPYRHQANSDHDAVWCSEPTSKRQHSRPATVAASRWGPRHLSGDYEAQLSFTAPPTSGDPHSQIRDMANCITITGGGHDRFHESNQLKAQRQAAHRLPAGAAGRAAWKAVSRARKQEIRAWLRNNIHRASQMDWRAKRTLDNHQARQGWEHHLLDDIHWQRSLHKHFNNVRNDVNCMICLRMILCTLSHMKDMPEKAKKKVVSKLEKLTEPFPMLHPSWVPHHLAGPWEPHSASSRTAQYDR